MKRKVVKSIHKIPSVHELGSFFDIAGITEHRFTVAAGT